MPPPGFDELTVDEQIEYVLALWDRIPMEEEEVSAPEWHRAEIKRRLAEHKADPSAVRPWREVRADLRERLKTCR